ncbi:MAG TPA: PilZ domain-containing protein [Terriglobales bacterium]
MTQTRFEPRTPIVAVAEICWDEHTGAPARLAARLEDTSLSGACLRVKSAFAVGSRLRIKWHREQFLGVVRNCRSDGSAFLVGVLREKNDEGNEKGLGPAVAPTFVEVWWRDFGGNLQHSFAAFESRSELETCFWFPAPIAVRTELQVKWRAERYSGTVRYCRREGKAYLVSVGHGGAEAAEPLVAGIPVNEKDDESVRVEVQGQKFDGQEKNDMRSTNLFSGFWGHSKGDGGEAGNGKVSAVPSNEVVVDSGRSAPDMQGDLLTCEDIYHASGILTVRSGYGINRVVDMLRSKHITELPREAKRASVLMALEAAGTSVDEVLQDATRRQHALNTYEAGQVKLAEELEARIAKENGVLQAELERVSAHYAERIKRNLEQVAQEKDALRAWQSMKEQESQRIAEAVAVCGKPIVGERLGEGSKDTMAALAATHLPAGSA